MMFLAIDTATSVVGLSLDDGHEVLTERVFRAKRHHTAELAPEVALVLRNGGIRPTDLTGLAVTQGPGSYTGLRIGMALAKGLALAHGLPLVGVPTLDVVARAQPEREESLLAVMRAGRGRVGAVWYKWGPQGWQSEGQPESFSWDEVLERLQEPTYVCGEIGDAADSLSGRRNVVLADPSLNVRRPSVLAVLAREALEGGAPADARELKPIYLGDLENGSQ